MRITSLELFRFSCRPREQMSYPYVDGSRLLTARIVDERKLYTKLLNLAYTLKYQPIQQQFQYTYCEVIQNNFFTPSVPTCPCGLRGLLSWAWQKCNRLLRLGHP